MVDKVLKRVILNSFKVICSSGRLNPYSLQCGLTPSDNVSLTEIFSSFTQFSNC